ncbi:MAG TPA: carbohydrate kinase family protein [Solirubrobacteraceae bacterium]|nr:carbohydrate kinase family protein [Solirubrobacteraceae bacterium]
MNAETGVITLGVHVVDVLVRPVEMIPEGQGGQLVEQIRISPAGSAGGTAITLSKLGASVRSAGAIGDDELADVLRDLLSRFGVDTTGCGDAFSAGFLRGLALGRAREDAAVLGCAVAALVAQGLGSDHGDFDLAKADAFINHSNKAVSR